MDRLKGKTCATAQSQNRLDTLTGCCVMNDDYCPSAFSLQSIHLSSYNQNYKNEIVIRIPLIPGFNNDEDNIVQTLEFLRPLEQVKGVDLLPFNVFPVAKYEALSQDWDYLGVKRQSDECLDKLKGIVESYERFRCRIGGLW